MEFIGYNAVVTKKMNDINKYLDLSMSRRLKTLSMLQSNMLQNEFKKFLLKVLDLTKGQ